LILTSKVLQAVTDAGLWLEVEDPSNRKGGTGEALERLVKGEAVGREARH